MPIYPADRITPADAGKTTGQKATQWRLEDHPRGCGENTQIPSAQLVQLGSPPRMRGKRSNFSPRCIGLGITPADAGKTPCRTFLSAHHRDHPRGCGENLPTGRRGCSGKGSPPRMRGKLSEAASEDEQGRITPADAGKTSFLLHLYGYTKDHPRGCGENFCGLSSTEQNIGSPPRMRGKLDKIRCERIAQRITPADAGKTPSRLKAVATLQDHPRGCGENTDNFFGGIPAAGSPPRMRGKPRVRRSTARRPRITPADAGKTSPFAETFRIHRDHPRGCGENTKKIL